MLTLLTSVQSLLFASLCESANWYEAFLAKLHTNTCVFIHVGWNERISKSVLANPDRPGFLLTGTTSILSTRAILLRSPIILESSFPSPTAPAKDSDAGSSLFADLLKQIMSTSEWGVIPIQRSCSPVTTLKTPGGTNSRIYSEIRSTVSVQPDPRSRTVNQDVNRLHRSS